MSLKKKTGANKVNTTGWQSVHYYLSCMEMADRNGLEIKQGSSDEVQIMARKSPYVDGICLNRISGFYAAMKWLEGYEQKMFEIANTKE